MRRFLVFFFFIYSLSANSQYFNDGQSRSGIKWKKIESINFEVIYPDGFDAKAAQIAQMMEKSYQYVTISLNQKPKKISVILHTETVKSNAFLGWAPSRIEMYTTPHQRIYSQDWLEQLAIHEYRHMVQISKLESEMPKLMRWIFGEQAAAFLTAAYLPFWFIEGDAVAIETGLSNSGRGRLPDFHKELRTQVIENKIFSYDKAYLGSYKDHVPNYYQLGYFLAGGARMLYNKPIWDEVVSNVARKPLSLVPFDKGLRKSIGLNKTELYDTVFNYLEKRWKAEDQLIHPSSYQTVSTFKKQYNSYRYGFRMNDSLHVAERISYGDVTRFVSIDESGKEKVLFTPGYHYYESVSGKENQLIWSERLSHFRWNHADRSMIRILNIDTGKLIEHKYNMKLFSPVLSPDFKKFIAVEADHNYQFFLVIFDAESGEIINKLINPLNDFYITPSWSNDGKSIYTVLLRNNEKGIAKIEIINEKIEMVLPFKNQEIIKPFEIGDEVYFIGGYTGVDHLYSIKKGSSVINQVISSRFGLCDPSFHNNELTYSSYTSNGYQLVKTSLDSLQFVPVNIDEIKFSFPIADAIAEQEKGVIDFSELDEINFIPQKYSKTQNLFHFHSWAPVSINPYQQTILPGVSAMSQNMLSTAEFTAGYRYRWESKQGELYAKFRYYGWLPVIDMDVSHGKRESYYLQINQFMDNNNQVVRVDTMKNEFGWAETNFGINTYLPIDLSKGRYYRKIQPRLKYNLTNLSVDSNAPSSFPDGIYHSVESGLYMYHILNSSSQDVLPNFGAIVDISYLTILPGVVDFGTIFTLSTTLFLPGIAKNHGIGLYQGAHIKQRADYAFSDRVRFPRGHQPILNDRMYTIAADYRLPLFYPDVKLGRWVYFKRFKMLAFYDTSFYDGTITNNQGVFFYSGHLQSTGIELTSDLHLLRFIAPIELGVRSSYLFDQTFKFDFLFNIQFSF